MRYSIAHAPISRDDREDMHADRASDGRLGGTIASLCCGIGSGAHAQQAAGAWKPAGNVEFVVGAGAGGENDRIAQGHPARPHQGASGRLDDGAQQAGRRQIIAMNYLVGKKGDANEIGLASGSFINAIARKGSDLHQQLTPLIKLFDAYQCYFTSVDSPFKTHGRMCAIGSKPIPAR